MSAALDRLKAGYYNNNLKSDANPGGLAGTGAVRANFFAGLLADFLSVVDDVTTAQDSLLGGANAQATSTSNIAVGAVNAAMAIVVQAGKTFAGGMPIICARSSDPLNTFMVGKVTAYDSVTGALNFTVLSAANVGAGPFNDWTVFETGELAAVYSTLNAMKDFRLTGVIAPAALAADVNDWNPAGLSSAAVVKASSTADRLVTGMVPGGDGDLKVIQNTNASFSFTFGANNAASAAANRFDLVSDFVLRPKRSVLFIYDATAQRWRANGLGAARASDIRAGTATDLAITPGDAYAALQEVNLTDAATVAIDLSAGSDFVWTVGANGRTIGNPTNPKVGQPFQIRVVGGGFTGHAFGANWKRQGGPPVFTGQTDFIKARVISPTYILYDLRKNPS